MTLAHTPVTFVQLMTQSEHALWKTDAQPEYYRVPVARLLDNGSQYRVWEALHSSQMRYIAGCGRRLKQAIALRKMAVQLIHRRGLFDYLRNFKVNGEFRQQLFKQFYGPVDFRAAVITEHRRYVLAASSGFCAEVLTDAVDDSAGRLLLDRYHTLYQQYFEIYSHYCRAEYFGDVEFAAAMKPAMLEQRAEANRLRRQLLLQPRRTLRYTSVARQARSA